MPADRRRRSRLPPASPVGCRAWLGAVRRTRRRSCISRPDPSAAVEVELLGRQLSPGECGVALMSAGHPEVARRRREPNGVPIDHDRSVAGDQEAGLVPRRTRVPLSTSTGGAVGKRTRLLSEILAHRHGVEQASDASVAAPDLDPCLASYRKQAAPRAHCWFTLPSAHASASTPAQRFTRRAGGGK